MSNLPSVVNLTAGVDVVGSKLRLVMFSYLCVFASVYAEDSNKI
jgi:hypothetical protein